MSETVPIHFVKCLFCLCITAGKIYLQCNLFSAFVFKLIYSFENHLITFHHILINCLYSFLLEQFKIVIRFN